MPALALALCRLAMGRWPGDLYDIAPITAPSANLKLFRCGTLMPWPREEPNVLDPWAPDACALTMRQ